MENHDMNEMQVMDPTGHTSLKWSPGNEAEVEAAATVFRKMRKKGYSAFYTGFGGRKGERMDEFDPDAKQFILIPHLVGG